MTVELEPPVNQRLANALDRIRQRVIQATGRILYRVEPDRAGVVIAIFDEDDFAASALKNREPGTRPYVLGIHRPPNTINVSDWCGARALGSLAPINEELCGFLQRIEFNMRRHKGHDAVTAGWDAKSIKAVMPAVKLDHIGMRVRSQLDQSSLYLFGRQSRFEKVRQKRAATSQLRKQCFKRLGGFSHCGNGDRSPC